jgi:AraC family transcriptional regulator, regulatory protein of adaptative response / methylated-DNA-[protein]-cysteine methyltransferase
MMTQQENNLYQQLLGTYQSLKASTQPYLILTVSCIETPLGTMIVIADDAGVHLLQFLDCYKLQRQVKRLVEQSKAVLCSGTNGVIDQLKQELAAYFAGTLQNFTTPLYCGGTQFQQSVWQQLQKIPYGQTKTYQQQAQSLGKLTAFRAVANANGANQLAIIIPCHRIVMSSGAIGGYAGGVWRKQFLLEHERMTCS